MSADENLEEHKATLKKAIDGLLDGFLDLRLAVDVAKTKEDIQNLWVYLRTHFIVQDEKEETTEKDTASEPNKQEGETST